MLSSRDSKHYALSSTIVAAALSARVCIGVARGKKQTGPRKRARPPKWSADVLDAFFDDARDKARRRRGPTTRAAAAAADSEARQTLPAALQQQPTGATWSKLIDAETIETEIKRLAQAVANDVTTPSAFKGGEYQGLPPRFQRAGRAVCRRGRIRWRRSLEGRRPPRLRDRVRPRRPQLQSRHRSNVSAKRPSAKQDLADLVAGSRPQTAASRAEGRLGQVADRPPLMQRLNIAHEDRLTNGSPTRSEFDAASRRRAARSAARGRDCRRDRPRGIRLLRTMRSTPSTARELATSGQRYRRRRRARQLRASPNRRSTARPKPAPIATKVYRG